MQFYVRHTVWHKWKSCRTCQSFAWFVWQVLRLTTALGPVGLCVFRFFNSLWRPFQFTLMSCIVGVVLSPVLGLLERSSWQNTDLNCSSNFGVTLEKSIVVLQWRYTRKFLSFAFHIWPEFLRVLTIITHCVFYVWFAGPPDLVLYFSFYALDCCTCLSPS